PHAGQRFEHAGQIHHGRHGFDVFLDFLRAPHFLASTVSLTSCTTPSLSTFIGLAEPSLLSSSLFGLLAFFAMSKAFLASASSSTSVTGLLEFSAGFSAAGCPGAGAAAAVLLAAAGALSSMLISRS